MEMNPCELIEDSYFNLLYFPNSPKEEVFKDPEVQARVGVEYQVEIPPLMSLSAYILHESTMESPMEIMQMKEEIQETKHESLELLSAYDSSNNIESPKSEKMVDDSGSSGFKVETEMVIEKGECSSGHVVYLSEPWSDTEQSIFLLGLYIFGKSFDQVKRFTECKKMGEVLLFYYGRFYASSKYHKWKKKCERRMSGSKIFTGSRQRELLSRLLPGSPKDCHHNMHEVSKSFEDGNISLEEYVFTLKSMVGINNLIEAVGIGKRKQDLTRITRDCLKPLQNFRTPAEVPLGKACSTLADDDIIKFLTGDFRLSKTRSSDLFWEAIWPRLLARGWHSEQPRSKQSLVFLIPGIQKFRRKLVKGDHYFDSVTDVLSKVASEPELLELEMEKNVEKESRNNMSDDEKLPKLSSQQYLQPRTPKKTCEELAKITIIDTSLAHGGNVKVREVRCLEIGSLNILPIKKHSEQDTDSESSVEAINESDPANSLEGLSSDRNDSDGFRSNGVLTEKLRPKKNSDKFRKPGMAKSRDDNSIYLAPVLKRRRRLSACISAEENHISNGALTSPRSKHEDCSDNRDDSDTVMSLILPSQKKSSSSKSCNKCNLTENNEGNMDSSFFDDENYNEKPQEKMLIDLNANVPHDAETKDPLKTQAIKKQGKQKSGHQIGPSAQESTEQHQNMNTLRQSTRNRPLTPKALEALANGYLTIKERRKRGKEYNPVSRPSRRTRMKEDVTENCGTSSFGKSKVEEENSAMFDDFQIKS